MKSVDSGIDSMVMGSIRLAVLQIGTLLVCLMREVDLRQLGVY